MTREVQQIPLAPRHSVRWSAALWHRWPLALMSFLLTVYGGLWTLMLFFASAGKPIDDARLDSSASIVRGIVVEVDDTNAQMPDGTQSVRIHYRFPIDGNDVYGKSFASIGPKPGDAIDVQFLAGAFHVNRASGGRISLLGDFVTPAFSITVIPGVGLLLAWVFGVARTRHLLVHGDVAVANLVEVRRVPLVVPTMLEIRFTFRDRSATEQAGRHWVRERSPLGARVLSQPSSIVVIHDRELPQRYRLIIADEFATEAA